LQDIVDHVRCFGFDDFWVHETLTGKVVIVFYKKRLRAWLYRKKIKKRMGDVIPVGVETRLALGI
jgi:hypothetical protein